MASEYVSVRGKRYQIGDTVTVSVTWLCLSNDGDSVNGAGTTALFDRQFYVRRVEDEDEFKSVMSSIREKATSGADEMIDEGEESVEDENEVTGNEGGSYGCVAFHDTEHLIGTDDAYYRCEASSSGPEMNDTGSQVLVLFLVDTGHVIEVDADSPQLRPLPAHFLRRPLPFAVRCSLAGGSPTKNGSQGLEPYFELLAMTKGVDDKSEEFGTDPIILQLYGKEGEGTLIVSPV